VAGFKCRSSARARIRLVDEFIEFISQRMLAFENISDSISMLGGV
jgi:hypothetical protein